MKIAVWLDVQPPLTFIAVSFEDVASPVAAYNKMAGIASALASHLHRSSYHGHVPSLSQNLNQNP